MTAARDRKEAAKRLGVALYNRYRKLLEAGSPEEISKAAMNLGQCFNDNIEFVCWVLKEYGGISQMPFVRSPRPVNGLPVLPTALTGQDA